VINSTEVSCPTRQSRIYLLRNKLFLVHLLGIRQTEILDVLSGFFPWVLHEVGLDVDESKDKIDVVNYGQEMGGNASLPTVINSTEVSGPTRQSRIYLVRNKLFLVHLLGIRQTEILDVLEQIFSFGVTRSGLDLQENKKEKN
jgi:hypothetical protein